MGGMEGMEEEEVEEEGQGRGMMGVEEVGMDMMEEKEVGMGEVGGEDWVGVNRCMQCQEFHSD